MKDLLFYFVAKKDESFIEEYFLDGNAYSYDSETRNKMSILISKEYRDIQNRGVVFLILRGKVRAISSFVVGTANVTNKKRISLKNIFKLTTLIDMEDLIGGVGKSFSRHIPITSESHEVILPAPAKTKKAIMVFLNEKNKEAYNETMRLYELANLGDKIPSFKGADIFQVQKDSLLFTLGMVSSQRKFSVEDHLTYTKENEMDPFQLLLSSNAVEDDMIYHDASNFGDIASVKQFSNGSFYYRDPNSKCELMITNCNRKKLESTLGVDLIIYNGLFKSYLLIQYKRMTSKSEVEDRIESEEYDEDKFRDTYGRQFGFRPDSDSNFSKELIRMNNVFESVSKNQVEDLESIHDWRLGNDFLYFKLCGALKQKMIGGNLVPGMYLPLSYINKLLKHETTLGPRGGRILTYDNCLSYIGKDMFQDLAKRGLVGSRNLASNTISEYIKKTLDEDKSVVLAEIQLAANSGV